MWWLGRKGSSGFSASSTAEEVTQGIDGTHLTAIAGQNCGLDQSTKSSSINVDVDVAAAIMVLDKEEINLGDTFHVGAGATSGIGVETARVLALRNVHVVMGIRNMAAGGEIKEIILRNNPTAKIDMMELDLSSMESVRNFASQFNFCGLPLNILVYVTVKYFSSCSCNIYFVDGSFGIMATPFKLSKDSIELQFATNHIGHFLLTNLLLETMKRTAIEQRKEGRIVNVASRRHKLSYPEGIRFDKINDKSGSPLLHWYNSLSAYGQSKLANVLHAKELARRLKEEGTNITANSVSPGPIATNLYRYHNLMDVFVGLLGKYVMKDIQQGAATTCYVALHPQVKGLTGCYFADSNLSEASSQAADPELAMKLWEYSSNMVSNDKD
ncbi:hypothetical protein Fmac_015954 [Flemingia macrophylla]|uniref:Short-chain dehydrogenase TIC 32, chloroplastic n=1 Tax=Flemingia macrophylla TaxID=520843 RepID=A0ABD1MG58_9FABA